jgi:EAL domain-containing protein (putative c-di-GMP-specific phosphodiesterase class I)
MLGSTAQPVAVQSGLIRDIDRWVIRRGRGARGDIGTGYSGFTFLKRLPIDYQKIDVEFVGDLASNTVSRHVV